MLSPTSLHAFRVAVEVGTFRGAAERLAVSQPAISNHIRRLEEELGVQLFQRPYGRTLRPTEAGRLLYRYAVTWATNEGALRRFLDELVQGHAGVVRLGLMAIGKKIMKLLADFRKENDNAVLILRSGSNAFVNELLARGELDVAIAYPTNHPDIVAEPFLKEPMPFLVAADHPLARRNPLKAEDLAGQPVITGIDGSRHHFLVCSFLQNLGVHDYVLAAQVEDPVQMLTSIQSGMGIGAVSYTLAEEALEQGSVVPLEIQGARQLTYVTTYLLRHRNVESPPVVQRLLQFLWDALGSLPVSIPAEAGSPQTQAQQAS